jgi:hypothetical protein
MFSERLKTEARDHPLHPLTRNAINDLVGTPYNRPRAKEELHREGRELPFSRRGWIIRRQQNGLNGQGFPEGGFHHRYLFPWPFCPDSNVNSLS